MLFEAEQDNVGAIYRGEPVQLPLDLFIPPDALELWLEAFEGPFDLLLYLIRRNNFDILDIPISEITRQYMAYVDLLKKDRFELASDYLVMAAWLAEIKSRLLLPKHPTIEDDSEEESDPRKELIERLQLYAQYKQAAMDMDALPRFNEHIFSISPALPELIREDRLPQIHIDELTAALKKLLKNQAHFTQHVITTEVLSVQERMVNILDHLSDVSFLSFEKILNLQEGKLGIVVSFIAILELSKQQMIEIVQDNAYGTINLKLK
ncbi:segregation and condensation protein A [Wohlfahrtiimonas larvae]|uniref:Segregation and condensation protein A n=1 Tax=Wohlfahrtiimonas larvae TaxID=1157986 RepID=A0ABP9MYW3_9GAMM|nr:ScpA family protein [Wohlfahrtiimonas larvae]